MPRSQLVHHAAWAVFGVLVTVHVIAMATGAHGVTEVTQPMASPLLLLALLSASARADRTTVLVAGALLCSWCGDLLPLLVPLAEPRLIPAASFLGALVFFCLALAPLWARTRDRMKLVLAIPYGAIVVGLYAAFTKGAAELMPILAPYAVLLALMAFLAAGVNALTWMGGTLFMASNALLGMLWFLPGAWMPHSDEWVMATYFVGQAFLVAGFIRTFPERRWEREDAKDGSGSFLILEG